MIHDLADRRDDSCGTAKATLCEILYLIEVNLALLDIQSEVILCYDEQRTTGDGRQDAVGLRGNDLIVLCDEQEVRSAGLLDLRSGRCVEVHIFIIALTVRIHDRVQAHRVVQAGLDVTGAMRCCAVVVADTDRDRLYAALEVRAYRSDKYTELVLIRRLYTDDCVASEHVRTDVERSA